MSIFCVLCICVLCVFFDPAFDCYTAINVCVSTKFPICNYRVSDVELQPGPARPVIHCVVETTEKARVLKSVTKIWSFNEPDNLTAKCDVIWKLGRDKTKLSCLVCSSVHTADADKTRQFCLVRVGGVNTPLLYAYEQRNRRRCETPQWLKDRYYWLT